MKSTATIRHTFYMLSEVGWLAFVCNPLPHSISGLLTNGLIGNSDLNSFTKHPFWQQRTIVGRSVHYSTAWMDDNTEGSHPQASPVQIEVGTQRWLPGSTSLSKYLRTWFLNAHGSSGATKKKASPRRAIHHQSLQFGGQLCLRWPEGRSYSRSCCFQNSQHKPLSERLQLDLELTLKKAKKIVQQHEAVQE